MRSTMGCRLEDQGGLLTRRDLYGGPEVGQDKRRKDIPGSWRSFSQSMERGKECHPQEEWKSPVCFNAQAFAHPPFSVLSCSRAVPASLGHQLQPSWVLSARGFTCAGPCPAQPGFHQDLPYLAHLRRQTQGSLNSG